MSSDRSKHCPSCHSRGECSRAYGDRHGARGHRDLNGERRRIHAPRMSFRRRDGETIGWGREGGVRLDAPPMIRREREPMGILGERMRSMDLRGPGGRPPLPRGPRRPPRLPEGLHDHIAPLDYPDIPPPSPYMGYADPYVGPVPGAGIPGVEDMFPAYQGPNPYERFPPHMYPRRYPQPSPHGSPPMSPLGPREPHSRPRGSPLARPSIARGAQAPQDRLELRPRRNSNESGAGNREPNVPGSGPAPARPRIAEQAMGNYRPPYVESYGSGFSEEDDYYGHDETMDRGGHSLHGHGHEHGNGHSHEHGHGHSHEHGHGHNAYWYEGDDYDDGYGEENERYLY